MAKKIIEKEIFLPRWQRWYLGPMFVFLIGLFTYLQFFSPRQEDKMGLIPYFIMLVFFLFIFGMTYAMTTGKLPAYVIHEKVEDDKDE